MEPLTQREKEILEETFSLYDTIGDAKIDIAFLGEALRGLGLNPTEGDVTKITKELETSGSKRMSFEEFLPIYLSLQNASRTSDRYNKNKQDFYECFRVFDKDQNGTISAGELQHVLTTLGEALSPSQVDVLTQGLEDKEGRINYEEFVNLVVEG